MRRDVDRAVERLASHQAGVFSRAQLADLGAGRGLLHRRVAAGRWRRLSHAVIAVSGAPSTRDRRLWSAVLHTPGAVISHTAAARLHELPYLRDDRVEVTVPYGTSTSPFARLHRSIDLTEPDIVCIGRRPVSSVARTAADLLTVLSRPRVERIIDDLLNSRRVTHEALVAAHSRYEGCGRPTTVAMREILAERGPGYVAPASVLEAKAVALFEAAGLPEPSRQVPLPGWGEEPGLADLAFVEQRVLVELDGRRWHGRDQAFQRDRERDHAAMLAGWLPLRFTARHLDDRPDYTVATVRGALTRAR